MTSCARALKTSTYCYCLPASLPALPWCYRANHTSQNSEPTHKRHSRGEQSPKLLMWYIKICLFLKRRTCHLINWCLSSPEFVFLIFPSTLKILFRMSLCNLFMHTKSIFRDNHILLGKKKKKPKTFSLGYGLLFNNIWLFFPIH